MIFSEIYGCYFNAVAEILEEAVQKKLTNRKMTEIIQRKAFSESTMTILDALKSEEWPLVTKELTTPIRNTPTQPLTILQKRWMKSLLLDPRIHLFEPDDSGLEDVKPLYEPQMFVYYDRYGDGDPYENEFYRENFRMVLHALRNKEGLKIQFSGRTGRKHEVTGVPQAIEYSAKDDKFRLKLLERYYETVQSASDMGCAVGNQKEYSRITEINMARMESCQIVEMDDVEIDDISCSDEEFVGRKKKTVVLELKDERDSLRRAMLHFSYLEKETMQLDEKMYRVTIHYDQKDETELLIQILSFGPLVRVVGPAEFCQKMRERIQKQVKRFSRMGQNRTKS